MGTSQRSRSVGDIEGFIYLLRAACEDSNVNATLEEILSMPDDKRQAFLHGLTNDLVVAGAPRELLEALACLTDNEVAEKAYEVIFRCRTLR